MSHRYNLSDIDTRSQETKDSFQSQAPNSFLEQPSTKRFSASTYTQVQREFAEIDLTNMSLSVDQSANGLSVNPAGPSFRRESISSTEGTELEGSECLPHNRPKRKKDRFGNDFQPPELTGQPPTPMVCFEQMFGDEPPPPPEPTCAGAIAACLELAGEQVGSVAGGCFNGCVNAMSAGCEVCLKAFGAALEAICK